MAVPKRGKRRPVRRAKKTGVAATANRALALAKQNAQSIEIQHFLERNAVSITSSSLYTIDGIDMTAATPTGWSSKAQYTGSNTGMKAWSIGQFDQGTTADADGYRSGNELQLRNFWIKMQLEGSAASNIHFRLMVVRTNRLLTPDMFEPSVYFGGNTIPDIYGFVSHGKAGAIKQILYDKKFTIQKRDDTSTKGTKFIDIYRKVNKKIFYGENTIGGGTGATRRDVVLGTSQYYLVLLTDEVTNLLGGHFQMLTNYVP